MDLYKLGLKLFVADPGAVRLHAFIPVFHRWIQQQAIAAHLLVDVHDYSHVHHGPGILLVAHQANFSLDEEHGRPGLSCYRKQPLPGSVPAKLTAMLKTTLQACRLLEQDPSLDGIRFRTDELHVVSNDRLLAPNTEESFQQLLPVVNEFLHAGFPDARPTLTRRTDDPRERLAIVVRTESRDDIAALLARLG
jgi:hypothetical protein